jgi:hypothetical protein
MYGRELTDDLFEISKECYSDWNADTFATAVRRHIRDPDRGRFFPVPADLTYQVSGDRNQAKVEAAAAFDANPLIDGTSKFDADRETYDRRDQRKRAYVARAAFDFEAQSSGGELMRPPQLPRSLGGALGLDQDEPA